MDHQPSSPRILRLQAKKLREAAREAQMTDYAQKMLDAADALERAATCLEILEPLPEP